MKIWPDNNGAAAIAYSQVQLVDASQQPVDLFIYNSNRGKTRLFGCLSDKKESWLEEGRPRELSSLPLATWSLLTTSIKEYQRGLREVHLRTLRRILLPTYFLWVAALFWSGAAYGEGKNKEGNFISILAAYGFFFMLFASIFVVRYFTQKHAQDIFHPSIQTVLQELERPLLDAGFEVRLMVEGNSTGKPVVSFLRFSPVRDDDRAAEAMVAAAAATENCV